MFARIIPARAGFTRFPLCAPGQGRDHPRSRGVYALLAEQVPHPSGSSPLARGLHGPRFSRIHRPADHPRSRGVYSLMACHADAATGSSPLARGLLLACEETIGVVRIIPARAGFTTDDRRTAQRARDHPRSRGVYAPVIVDGYEDGGSSPLARGLHITGWAECDCMGIIPARAGFTYVPRPP